MMLPLLSVLFVTALLHVILTYSSPHNCTADVVCDGSCPNLFPAECDQSSPLDAAAPHHEAMLDIRVGTIPLAHYSLWFHAASCL